MSAKIIITFLRISDFAWPATRSSQKREKGLGFTGAGFRVLPPSGPIPNRCHNIGTVRA